ncbi:MAG: integrase, partial [Gammaproteobacteria bacterium]|nr:integrase [Gammaproteobacteria bacterium]
KIIPSIADCGNHLRLKGSWTKGNIERTIFIRTEEQRQALDAAKLVAGIGLSLIPKEKSYIRHRHLYNQVARDLGQSNLHGLRHAFSQRLYKECTGWECPLNGGKNKKMMSDEEKKSDVSARELISLELGHSRLEITKVYLG